MDTIRTMTSGTLVIHGDHATLFAAIPDGTPRAAITGPTVTEPAMATRPEQPARAGLTAWRRPGLQSLARGA